jgi:flagellar protein FlaG
MEVFALNAIETVRGASPASAAHRVSTTGFTSDAAAPDKKIAGFPPAVQKTGGAAEPGQEHLKKMVDEMQGHLDSMNVSLKYFLYGTHENKVAVKVINKETGKVIREIPPKEMQALQTKMGELVGMLFDEMA